MLGLFLSVCVAFIIIIISFCVQYLRLFKYIQFIHSLSVQHRALLGYTVNTGSCNSEWSHDLHDVTCNNTEHCFSHTSDFRVYRRGWRQFSSVQVSACTLVATESSQPVRSQLLKWVIKELSAWVEKTSSGKRRFTWNIWSVRLLIVCALRFIARRQLV
jgi:hypothetical protein